MDKMLHLDVPMISLVIRGVVVYLSVLILLRLSGKKQMGQMNATEFVAILLISNAVQNAMNGGDNSLTGGVILAAVLILTSTGISYFTYRSKIFRAIFEGNPILLIRRGRIITDNLKKEYISESELHMLMRKQGFHHLAEIDSAILEADGTLSITHRDQVAPSQSIHE